MIQVTVHKDRLEIGEYSQKKLNQAVIDAGHSLRGYLELITPESRNQRKYLMGGLIPLTVFLDGNDYKDGKVCDYYFEFFKKEFAPEVMKIKGKIQIFGKSTRGSKALNSFTEKLQDYLHEQYAISYDNKAVNSDEYKRFRDEIFPIEMQYTDWIDYCVKMKFIKKPL